MISHESEASDPCNEESAPCTSSPPPVSCVNLMSNQSESTQEERDPLQKVIDGINEIAALPDCRGVLRKECGNLVRRLKLLLPLFEELVDAEKPPCGLNSMHRALMAAKETLQVANQGSRLFMAFEREHVASRLHDVMVQLEQALNDLSLEELALSDELKEQIELVHAQFKRAKERCDVADAELEDDLNLLLSQRSGEDFHGVLRRVSEKLQLKTVADLMQESQALHDMVISYGDVTEMLEQMSYILRKLKDFVLTENPDLDESSYAFCSVAEKLSSPVIPDEFRCPISLELMKDPVIIATGQTYERSCIQKWLDSGETKCPKTHQPLLHTVLTPNYVLRSLIAQWCEANGVEHPKKSVNSKTCGSMLDNFGDRTTVTMLLQKLSGGSSEEQRAAAGELRLLARRNASNRICIAESGAIPLLVNILSSPDTRTQEHAVTALLNLSIYENNKAAIVRAGAITPIVEVLKNGSMEARENAAAALFSLSVADENKVIIGQSGAIPPLVGLLCEGTQRGKKDAATALFNLLIFQGNKAKAVKAGVVSPLMQLLMDPNAGMVDESLAILAILVGHQEGKVAIGNANPIPILVDIIRTGSPRNKENAAAVLLALCINDAKHRVAAQQLGAYELFADLAHNGTARAQRKAICLLEHLKKSDQASTS